MTAVLILGGIAFYYVGAAYLDGIYQERAKAQARTRRPFPDIIWVGRPCGGKAEKPEKVDWQAEGF